MLVWIQEHNSSTLLVGALLLPQLLLGFNINALLLDVALSIMIPTSKNHKNNSLCLRMCTNNNYNHHQNEAQDVVAAESRSSSLGLG